MAKTLYRSTTCNVNTFDPNSQVAGTIREAWGKSDVLKLNEAGGSATQKVIRALGGADFYSPPGTVGDMNPIIWRSAKFKRVAAGVDTGYHGGKGDGPSRGVVWVLLEHKASGKRVLECNMHQIARAFSDSTDRQPEWNQIMQAAADEIARVRTKYDHPPTVISGDMNRSTGVGFPGLNETEVDLPGTLGGSQYDKFFLIGLVAHRSHVVFATNSDHKAVTCNLELTGTAPPKTTTKQEAADPASPTKAAAAASHKVESPHPGPPTSTPIDIDLRSRATYRARPRWRFFAQRAAGTGASNDILHPELPLSDVEIEDVLTGHNGLSGKISPQFGSMIAADGRPLLEEWGTEIWAEESGSVIHGGGVVTHSGFEGSDWSIECTGLTGYADDTPYASAIYFVETDPMDIFRHIWTHIQSQPGSNIGLQVDATTSGRLVGTELEQVEFDTESGPISFEAGPYKLAYYQNYNLDENLGGLAADTPFDWHEEHYWDGDILRHALRLGYPTIGRRRTDLRFVIGENIFSKPSIERDGAEYADEVWVFGAGEGAAMLRGVARRPTSRLRRVAVVTDSSLRSQAQVNARAKREVAWRNNPDVINEVVIRDHPHADVGSVGVGDEIQVQGDAGWVDLDAWYRVISRTITPKSPDRMKLNLMRTDRIAA